MKTKSFVYPLTIMLGTIAILYGIGYQFEIRYLRWDYETVIPDGDGFRVEYGGSVLPIVVGVAAGVITDRILLRKKVA